MPSTTVPRAEPFGPPRIAVAPAGSPEWVGDAVVAGGGHLVELADAEGLMWMASGDPKGLRALLAQAPQISWVQLPFAGVERFVELVDDDRVWTCGKGVYADPVAELALGLALAGLRHIGGYARAREWTRAEGRNLRGAKVTILGGGGITESLLRLLAPFECRVTVVRNSASHLDGADDVLEADRYVDALADADVVFVALALTPDTEGMIGRSELEQMQPHAWIVNVARGRHIVTDDLVWALRNGVIGGAALDVTDPEPLPADHALWSLPNCIITPHVGNTPEMGVPLLAERITANVRAFGAGEPLTGLVDPDAGY